MIKPKEDLTGQKFGMDTVIGQADDYIVPSTGQHRTRWWCQCDCGSPPRKIQEGNLKKKNGIRNCGCLNKKRLKNMSHKKRTKENKYNISGNFGILWTTNTNKEVYFDLEDSEKILNYTWHETKAGYAEARINKKNIKMHQLLGFIYGDHHNRNKLDNRKENLFQCTKSENAINRSLPSHNKSGVIGVEWHKTENKWRARLMKEGKRIELGQYTNKEDAIKARLKGEKKYFGEFAPQKYLYEQYGIL